MTTPSSSLAFKPTAGAGGRGMRVVQGPEALAEAYTGARDEAARLFGDATVFLERWLARARHIEVQVAADVAGTTWAIDVRDCSVQRLHQKLLEESPALGVSAEGERTLRNAARAPSRAKHRPGSPKALHRRAAQAPR